MKLAPTLAPKILLVPCTPCFYRRATTEARLIDSSCGCCRAGERRRKVLLVDNLHIHPLILVIESSPTLRKIIETTFNRAGGQTILYTNPKAALEVMRQNPFPPPDIAFISLDANKKSYHLIRFLRSRSQFKRLAIVAVSGKDNLLSRFLARCAGAVAYLPKPFTIEQLTAAVMTYSQH